MKNKLDTLRLRWKIFAYLLGFCSLLIVILWLFQTVFLSEMYIFIRNREVDKAIVLVEQSINNSDLQEIIKDLSVHSEIFVATGDDFIPTTPQRPGKDRREPVAVRKTRDFILDSGETLSLTFNAIVSPVNATITTLRYQLYLITAIMLALSVVLALILAKRVSKPIENVNSSAKLLANGNYDIQFNGAGFLEISELSDTLNTAAAQLSKVETLRRELMANVSHDLRTPLSLIYSYAEVMHDFPGEIAPQQTQIIMDEAKRLSLLVDDVMDISKLESGGDQLVLRRFSLSASLQETTRRIQELVRNDGFSLDFEWQDQVFVDADEVKITQAYYNLLTNAINYTGEDKKVRICQLVENGQVIIQVCDSGEGVSEESLPYIWDRYYKVDKTHKRALTGTGLGLSIVRRVMELHGGSYGVDSTPTGSTFWLGLPLPPL